MTTLNNLAFTCGEMGDYRRELGLWEKVYALRRKVLGEEHSDTLWARSNLALTRRDLGDHTGEREELEQVLACRIKTQGEEHPDTLEAKANLARTLDEQGETEAALRHCDEILASQTKLSEKTVDRSAGVYERHGMTEKAKQLRAREVQRELR